MSVRLYVGNLSMSTSSAQLEALFAPFGKVSSAKVMEDRATGQSKGFGFVEMGSDEEAQAAIKELNGRVNDGRPLTVNEARPRDDGGGGGGGGGGGDRRDRFKSAFGRGGGGGYGGGGGGGGGRGGRGGRY